MEIEELKARYTAALHAVQTGVAYSLAMDGKDTSPKHLRVGINAAMCDHAALVTLLIAKGLFSEQEYLQAITEEMEAEVKRYEDHHGVKLA